MQPCSHRQADGQDRNQNLLLAQFRLNMLMPGWWQWRPFPPPPLWPVLARAVSCHRAGRTLLSRAIWAAVRAVVMTMRLLSPSNRTLTGRVSVPGRLPQLEAGSPLFCALPTRRQGA